MNIVEEILDLFLPLKNEIGCSITGNILPRQIKKQQLQSLINSGISEYKNKADMFDQIAEETDNEWIVKLDCPNCADIAEVFFMKPEE